MSKIRRWLSLIVGWYLTPAGRISALVLIATLVCVALGYSWLAILILVLAIGVLLPFNSNREASGQIEQDDALDAHSALIRNLSVRNRRHDRRLRHLNTRIRNLAQDLARETEKPAPPEAIRVAILNDVDRIAGDVAAMARQLEIHSERSLELQQRYGQLETKIAQMKLGEH